VHPNTMRGWEAMHIYIPHADPAMESLFQTLRTFCRWTVRFQDSLYICECTKHGYTVCVPTMGGIVVLPATIRGQLGLFPCVGDWG
jgi:hypothetical protein